MSEVFDKLFGKACAERGWATLERIDECLRRRTSGPARPLPDLLVEAGVLSPRQAEALGEEIARLTRSPDPEAARQEDTALARELVHRGLAAKEHVLEALSVQNYLETRKGRRPRLGEILFQKGYVSLACLEQFLPLQGKGSPAPPPPAAEARPGPAGPSEEELRQASADPRQRLGKYLLIRKLGHGGMGSVYQAWDPHLKRWVAIKILTVRLEGGEELLRFQREAQTVAALQHPHIVDIYDVARDGDRHYLVMKFVEGKTLAGQVLPPRRACELMIAVAQAVDYAHSQKVIHRDLKPQNIMVDTSGKPWVMDFGLAKHAEAMNLTSPGTVVGTPSYMSPEQAAGNLRQIDPRSDVYSLGAILYEILTGKPPFQGASAIETIKMVVNRPLTPPSQINPDVPRELEAIVLKAMEKDKSRRYPTALSFAHDLERYLAGRKATVRRISTLRSFRRAGPVRRWILWLVILGILALLTALAALLR